MTDAPSNGSLPPPVEPERRNLAVPIIAGATALVLLAALMLVFRGPRSAVEEGAEPADQGEATDSDSEPAPDSAPVKALDLLGPNPLDTTKTLVDAAQRARAWNPDALLAGIFVEVADGKPQGPIQVRYGVPEGGSIAPGSRLGGKRLALEYANGAATQTEDGAKDAGVALPEPNCPLDAAWLRATEAGIARSTKVTMRYESSKKLNRPVWTVQPAEGAARTLDGSSCAVVLR